MELLKFMNANENWEELLTNEPYFIKVKRDGDYILLKYNQLSSDFSLQIVRECRGSIFYRNKDGKYICVCRAFDKFGNYGESYVPDINWSNAVVEEKIDGSLIKAWHNNGWFISTNGTIDAFKAQIGDLDLNFGSLFIEAFGVGNRFDGFFAKLDTDYTYMFELVSPKSRLTVYYPETKLYYLGRRNMKTMEEDKSYEAFMHDYGILFPKCYNLKNIESCLSYVQTMTKDEEGFVIRDANFNRMKLKSPQYLMAFHMDNNGIITAKRIVNMAKMEMLDDFVAYCPQYKYMVDDVLNRISLVAAQMNLEWALTKYQMEFYMYDRKQFAEYVRTNKYKDFLFMKLDHPELNATDYIMRLFTRTILRLIKSVEVTK